MIGGTLEAFLNENRVCRLLGIKYPIIQGGMARISEAVLAAAASNAGGLGVIAAGNAPGSWVAEEIRKAKKLTDKPFAVNIMLLSPYAEEAVEAAISEKAPIVITGAGANGGLAARFHENNIKFIPVVPSVAIAKHMEKSGADALIAEGMEAGGHIGKLTSMCLIPQVADAVRVPVIGAGGIADGRGMAAAFALGAQAVQIGTRFLAAKECAVHKNYKEKVLKARDIDTEVTGSITGHPVRVLRNPLSARFLALEKEEMAKDRPDLAKFDALGVGALKAAVEDGDMENGTIMAGQIAGLVKREMSCEDIVQEIMEMFDSIINHKKSKVNE